MEMEQWSEMGLPSRHLPARRRSGVFIVYFEHVSHLVLVFLLLTVNLKLLAGYL